MAKLNRKRVILAKIEAVSGTDSTPTGSANAILVKNLDVQPLEGEMQSRDLIRPYLGGFEQLIAGYFVRISFEVELQGSGAAGTAPAYGVLLRGCGMSETVTASTKVEYSPISSAQESVTIYVNNDGILHKLVGSRGTVSMALNAKGIPVFRFQFIGKYVAPTDAAAPTPVYTGFKKPLIVNSANTPNFSLMGVTTLVLESLSIDLNNSLDFRALVGAEYTQITDRQVQGTITVETPPLATFNPWSTAIADTTGALQIIHGTAAGYKVQIDAPGLDVGQPTYGDSNGVNMLNLPFTLIPTSGDDEIKITIL